MNKSLSLLACLTALGLAACSTGPSEDYFYVSETDLEILHETRGFLSETSKWSQVEETQCDLEAEALTLFCALQKASFDVSDDFLLRRPALEEVRYAIDELSETSLDRRLIDFNNLETTDLSDIYKVIDMALVRIQARLDAQ